jgi:hypothetical protein
MVPAGLLLDGEWFDLMVLKALGFAFSGGRGSRAIAINFHRLSDSAGSILPLDASGV